MIDVAPAEPTPRQSRLSVLRRKAIEEASVSRSKLVPENSPAAAEIMEMEKASAELYVEQMLLLASLEEKADNVAKELKMVMASTGLDPDNFIQPAKIRNVTAMAQGGPFIDADNMSDAETMFFRHANRAGAMVDELSTVQNLIDSVPLSSPLTVSRRFTSGYGVRRDPINGRPAPTHYGIDFAAKWRAPVTATANGVVKFSGTRSGFGRVVEIDHGNGFVTRYAHLHRQTVKAGQKVKLHDKIGELGSSGRSTGPHVHYENSLQREATKPTAFH